MLNVVSIFKKGRKEVSGNYGLVCPTSVPAKIIEKFILGVTEKCLYNNAVIGHGQHRVTREKCHLTN